MIKYLKVYSIDISGGAAIVTWFFSKVLLINLPWFIYVLILLTVWVIYTLDHLMDARRTSAQPGAERYVYHQNYFYIILGLVSIAAGTGFLIAFFFLPKGLLIHGFGLALMVVLYFLLRYFASKIFAGLKELFAAVIYVSGVALPAYYYMHSFSFFFIMVVLQFFCLVFANLLICSIWDEELDKSNLQDSMTLSFGRSFINILILSLIFISVTSAALSVFLYSDHYLKIQLILLIMNLSLLLIYFFGEKSGEHIRRLLVDSIFFIPLLLLLL